MRHLLSACTLCLLGCLPATALAERADREQPVKLEADRVAVDDAKRTHVFEGNVVLSQGTLTIRAAKLVVTQDAAGFQKGVATGSDGLAHFRQKREGKDEYIEGAGERVEYDARTEKVEFFGRAQVKSGADEVNGHYIAYDGLTEKYVVTAAPGTTGAPTAAGSGRVTAIIQPKSAPAAR